jgi:hypothetical protein
MPNIGNVHVAFDPRFNENNTYFVGEDNANVPCAGSVYRNNPAAQLRWADTDIMAAVNNCNLGCNAPHPVGQYGIVLAFTGQALYSAHTLCEANNIPCGVDCTIDDGTGKFGPLSGMPKPGIAWDHLQAVFLAPAPCFILEPSSLKICGCCTLDTDSTLYAIDYRPYVPTSKMGMLWAYIDHTAKRKP